MAWVVLKRGLGSLSPLSALSPSLVPSLFFSLLGVPYSSLVLPFSVSSRIGRTYLSDPLVSQVHGVGCGKMEPPECAFRRSPGWRSGGRRVCVVGGGLDPPAPLKTPEYQWWGRIENKFICQILPDK